MRRGTAGLWGPKKYKYFNNKHFRCLPPVTAPGYYFTLNAVGQVWIMYAQRYRCFFSSFTGRDFHVESFFATDMSFGELSLIKSQSHLRSHIRIDQFSYSWNCSWPLSPWALIQNQQHGHVGLKQRNWARRFYEKPVESVEGENTK